MARPSPRSATASVASSSPLVRSRRSAIHGAGVFATKPIARGTRVLEYTGDRISHAEADRRYADRDYHDNHTFLFMVSERVVIDGGVGGNVARFINHSCDPSCVVEIVRGRIFIEALRAIAPGEELTYDYSLVRTPDDPPDLDEVFACRCGSPRCRGSMMAARPAPRRKPAAKKPAAKKPAAKKPAAKKPAAKKPAAKKPAAKKPAAKKPAKRK